MTFSEKRKGGASLVKRGRRCPSNVLLSLPPHPEPITFSVRGRKFHLPTSLESMREFAGGSHRRLQRAKMMFKILLHFVNVSLSCIRARQIY